MKHLSLFILTTLIAAALIVLPAPASAQSSTTTGSLRGQVTDPSGAVVTNAHSRHDPAAGRQGVQRSGTAKTLAAAGGFVPGVRGSPAPGASGTATSSCSGVITPCRRSMWAAKSGRAGAPAGARLQSAAGSYRRPCAGRTGKFATDRNHLHSPYRRGSNTARLVCWIAPGPSARTPAVGLKG